MDSIVSDISFTQNELLYIRQCIDLSTISAKDAKFVAQLQIKIDNEVQQMIILQKQADQEKQRQLDEIKSNSRKKLSTSA